MKTIRLIALFFVTAFSSQAYANLVLSPEVCDGGEIWCATSNDNSANKTLQELFGVDASDLLYKGQVGGSDEGSAASVYDTVFANTSNDPEDATISYTSGDALDCVNNECYLEVKDGKQTK